MRKQSKYNIWIENVLYNSFSDYAISFLNGEIQDIKNLIENPDDYESDNPELVQKFQELGYIINSDFDELEYILFQNRKETFQNKHYHLTINPTLQCNYKCWYCCVEEQETKYEQKRMNDETIQKIKNHILFMVEHEKIRSLFIDWFGGEPLMYFYEVIYPISKFAIEICSKNNITFTSHATTNAYYVDDKMISYFQEIKLTSFQIPIDGNEKKHNLVKNIDKIGHYKQILASINKIIERVSNSQIILRINYDMQTLQNATDIIQDVKTENRNKIFVDFQRVWQVALTKDEHGNNELLIRIKKEFEKTGFNTFYFAYSKKNRFKCCYADSYYHRVINYDGKIYKCSARDYADDLCIGFFNEDGSIEINKTIISKMFSDTTFKNEKCLNCIKLPLCFGPCIQKYYESKIGKTTFFCLHDSAEISFENYVKSKITKK
ncbi:MAG: radical SAM protein [Bacteroidales bacterium]|jgi:uncharacterized protein|nr:radical SAM protein [Bacteroidales bacterium]